VSAGGSPSHDRRIQNRAEGGFRVNSGETPNSSVKLTITPKGERAQCRNSLPAKLCETPSEDSTVGLTLSKESTKLRHRTKLETYLFIGAWPNRLGLPMVVCVKCLPADKPWDMVSEIRRSFGVALRACVRVYARVLVPPNLGLTPPPSGLGVNPNPKPYIHTYRVNPLTRVRGLGLTLTQVRDLPS